MDGSIGLSDGSGNGKPTYIAPELAGHNHSGWLMAAIILGGSTCFIQIKDILFI
jgi:hypothetical protein